MSKDPPDLNMHPNGVIFLPTEIGEVILLLPDAEAAEEFILKTTWDENFDKIKKATIIFDE